MRSGSRPDGAKCAPGLLDAALRGDRRLLSHFDQPRSLRIPRQWRRTCDRLRFRPGDGRPARTPPPRARRAPTILRTWFCGGLWDEGLTSIYASRPVSFPTTVGTRIQTTSDFWNQPIGYFRGPYRAGVPASGIDSSMNERMCSLAVSRSSSRRYIMWPL